MKQHIVELLDYSLEIISKFQKNQENVSLSPQTQRSLDINCKTILDDCILPETLLEQDLFDFIFKFYTHHLPCILPYDINLTKSNEANKCVVYNVIASFCWFLSYQTVYLENIARLSFVVPSKVDVNKMYTFYSERTLLVDKASFLLSHILSSIFKRDNIDYPQHLIYNPGVNGSNIILFLNLTFNLSLTFSHIVSMRNLLQFQRYEPGAWGAQVWQMLHFISYFVFVYKADNSLSTIWYQFLVNDLHMFLPCDICSSHWKIITNPTYLGKGENLTQQEKYIQLHSLHNTVRINNGLEEYPLDSFLNIKETPFFNKVFLRFYVL